MYEFSIASGWQKIVDFLEATKVPSGSLDEELLAAGYLPSKDISFGARDGAGYGVIVHVRLSSDASDYPYIVVVSIGETFEVVAVRDFPALVELISKVGPAAEASAQAEIRELAELERNRKTVVI